MNPQRYPHLNHLTNPAGAQILPHDVSSMQMRFHMQPPGLPSQPMMFDPHIMGPPHMPNLLSPVPLSIHPDRSISAPTIERLQLPHDKITETGIIPNNPYYKLPAGLMVPLIPVHRTEYKPIDPKDLRLPFPKFPDENFLRMIDSYYANDADKRDSDAWEPKFIDTYQKQKEALSKMQSEMKAHDQ